MIAAGVPTAGYTVVARPSRPAWSAIAALPHGAQGRRAGRGQGRRDRGRRGRGARGARRRCSSTRRFGDEPVRRRGVPDGVELSAARAVRRRERAPARPRAGLQAHRRRRHRPEHRRHGRVLAGATASTPADRGRARARCCSRSSTSCARRGTPFHGVLYAGPDAHRRRPEGARVQRPLRRSGDPGRAPAPAAATCWTCSSARPRPAGWRASRSSGTTRAAVTVVLASRGYPASSSSGDVITRPRATPTPRSPTRAPRERRRRDRHRRRPRAQRDRARRRPRSRPRGRVCCRRHDHTSTARPTARDIAA